MFWAASRWTGEQKYLDPIRDEGPRILETVTGNALDIMRVRDTWGREIARGTKPERGSDGARHLAWQMTGDLRYLESLYADQIEAAALREYINTEGSLWIDRVAVATGELQRARLGGVAIIRNSYYPGHAVSWRFHAPATAQSAAILVPNATPESMKIIVYNLDRIPVKATMTAWDVEPGRWRITQKNGGSRVVELERTGDVELTLPPRATSEFELKLEEKGTPYWSRPDLGIGAGDVTVSGNRIKVKVHGLGSVDAPASSVALVDAAGKRLASAPLPALPAPHDLMPKTAEVTLTLPAGTTLKGAAVELDPDRRLKEITRMNNRAPL